MDLIEDRENDEADDVEMDGERARHPGINSRSPCTVITSLPIDIMNSLEQWQALSDRHIQDSLVSVSRTICGRNLCSVENHEPGYSSLFTIEILRPANAATYVDPIDSTPWKRLIIGRRVTGTLKGSLEKGRGMRWELSDRGRASSAMVVLAKR